MKRGGHMTAPHTSFSLHLLSEQNFCYLSNIIFLWALKPVVLTE